MKIRIRKEFRNKIFYLVFTNTELVSGIISRIKDTDKHYMLFDFDNITLEKLKKILNSVSYQTMYIMSDKEYHYRVICNESCTWYEYLSILVDLLSEGLDYQFFRWSIIRGYATIRITDKPSRKEENKIVAILNYDFAGDFTIFKNGNVFIETYQADKDGLMVNLTNG